MLFDEFNIEIVATFIAWHFVWTIFQNMDVISNHTQNNYFYMVKIIFRLVFSYQYKISDINKIEELRITLKKLNWIGFKEPS